jgi:soluble P-type ATPase
MFELDIPGYGSLKLEHLVSDFTGTLSVDGKLLPGVRERLTKAAGVFRLHVLTADTFGKARAELEGLPCDVHILKGEAHDIQKEHYVKQLGPDAVVALGNGNNDRRMLRTARLGIAVVETEGCSVEAATSADILVTRAVDAIDLLLNPLRLKATLRA